MVGCVRQKWGHANVVTAILYKYFNKEEMSKKRKAAQLQNFSYTSSIISNKQEANDKWTKKQANWKILVIGRNNFYLCNVMKNIFCPILYKEFLSQQ